ncbi:MAG: response regulator [Chitinivibrionales bacterium]|nr:response regulator [Chitinivibrionales bacterium]
MNETILVVDDEPDMLDILYGFLTEKGYRVQCAANAEKALDILRNGACDLLLSDINMPGKKGFELLNDASALYPGLKTALITAYDVRDYIRLARDYNVGNIISKTTPFNFQEIEVLVKNILSEEVFGLERYIDGVVTTGHISNSGQVETVLQKIIDFMPDDRHKRKFRQAAGEIIINAIYYGAREEQGDRKSEWDLDVTLDPDEEIIVSWGADSEKAGVAVRDQKGNLTKQTVLYWLERNTTRGDDGISLGLFDEHGKGIYISRETIDRFIINTKRNVTTEIVMLNYGEGMYNGYRPLWIHEF